jgi:hypothetical protein
MQTIPVMVEPNIQSRSHNKTLRRKAHAETGTSINQEKVDKNITTKEIDNILYVKNIITPSLLSTQSYSTPNSENVVLLE